VEGATYKGKRVPGSLFDRIERWGEEADRFIVTRTDRHIVYRQRLKPLDRPAEDGRSAALTYLGDRIRKLDEILKDLVER